MDRTTWLQDRRMQKFRDVLSRWESRQLSMLEAAEILGMSERQFRRYRERYEASVKRISADTIGWMLDEYRTHYRGWNVKHFHEELQRRHGFHWGYTWVKAQLHAAGLVERAERRGAHRRKRPRKPCVGMMLRQDGSRFRWLAGRPGLHLIITMDDATSTNYSAFLVEEEGTTPSFQALLEVFAAHGLPSSLYTDRSAIDTFATCYPNPHQSLASADQRCHSIETPLVARHARGGSGRPQAAEGMSVHLCGPEVPIPNRAAPRADPPSCPAPPARPEPADLATIWHNINRTFPQPRAQGSADNAVHCIGRPVRLYDRL